MRDSQIFGFHVRRAVDDSGIDESLTFSAEERAA
jgi:hypothetical protein